MPRKPNWEEDEWILCSPDPTTIVCRTCALRARDWTDSAGNVHLGCVSSYCKFYFKDKPGEVLFDGKPCKYYFDERKGIKQNTE